MYSTRSARTNLPHQSAMITMTVDTNPTCTKRFDAGRNGKISNVMPVTSQFIKNNTAPYNTMNNMIPVH